MDGGAGSTSTWMYPVPLTCTLNTGSFASGMFYLNKNKNAGNWHTLGISELETRAAPTGLTFGRQMSKHLSADPG